MFVLNLWYRDDMTNRKKRFQFFLSRDMVSGPCHETKSQVRVKSFCLVSGITNKKKPFFFVFVLRLFFYILFLGKFK